MICINKLSLKEMGSRSCVQIDIDVDKECVLKSREFRSRMDLV